MKHLILLFISALITFTVYSKADSTMIAKFATACYPSEKQFIIDLKNKDFNKCMTFFTEEAKNNFDKDFLLSELKVLSNYYKEYPNPEINYYIGEFNNGVGAFGHDANGTIELECNYSFRNKNGKSIYSFRIYYTNKQPVSLIKKFETTASVAKKIKR